MARLPGAAQVRCVPTTRVRDWGASQARHRGTRVNARHDAVPWHVALGRQPVAH